MDKNILACYNPFQQKKFYLLIYNLYSFCSVFPILPTGYNERIYKEDAIGA